MTPIMQIYVTILLGLILLTVIFLIINKLASDSWYYDTLEAVSGVIAIISFIVTISWIVYLLLALIWHWY